MPQEFPFTEAQSTGLTHRALLASVLASDALDEISNGEDFEAVERYFRNQGLADSDGKIIRGMMFWIYPTGLHGPYHKSEKGTIEQHGTLMTVARGATVAEAMIAARRGFTEDGTSHVHVPASGD
ncbi:hypothetical protein BJ165DRAFT_1407506 [Panaeolus papilionaceus]|nr:hypothetical protein BJ165DRAFT_1407506 [Panaeolus papilionaceus]